MPSPTTFNRRTLVFQLAGLLLAVLVAVGLQARERSHGPRDLYGYSVFDGPQPGACRFDYVELDARARALPLVAGHPRAAQDDTAAVLELARPFEFYQDPRKSLVVSANGYLAAAGSLSQDDGSDYSNHCTLPAAGNNPTAAPDRIFVYHDDLRPRAGARVRHAFFPECPRRGEVGAIEACTVIEWDGFERNGPLQSSQPLRMQAVLYHGSHAIVMQYASVDDSRGAQATIGLQGMSGRSARRASCDVPDRVGAGQSLCFFDPRFRQGTLADGSRLR